MGRCGLKFGVGFWGRRGHELDGGICMNTGMYICVCYGRDRMIELVDDIIDGLGWWMIKPVGWNLWMELVDDDYDGVSV